MFNKSSDVVPCLFQLVNYVEKSYLNFCVENMTFDNYFDKSLKI